MTVVIGCDNKAILSRTAPNTYRILFAPRAGTTPYNMEPLSFHSSNIAITPCAEELGYSRVIAAERASNAPWLYGDCSSDQLGQSTVIPPDYINATSPPADQVTYSSDPHLMGGGQGTGALVDDQGRHYMQYNYRASGSTPGNLRSALIRSTDYTQSQWEVVLLLGPVSGINLPKEDGPGNMGCVFAKGYLWWIASRQDGGLIGSNDLLRLDVETGALLRTTIDWAGAGNIDPSRFNSLSNFQDKYELLYSGLGNTIFGVNRGFVWNAASTQVYSSPILYIDISDVDSPVVTFSGGAPFGSNLVVVDIQSYGAGSVALAKVYHQTPENPSVPTPTNRRWDQGAIYRSGNGGLAWTLTAPLATNLGASTRSASLVCGPSGFHYNDAGYVTRAVAIDQSEGKGYVVGAPPYIYVTEDQGWSWSIETVDLSIFDPYIQPASCDEAANQFTSIGICSSCIEPIPGLALLDKNSVLQWLRMEF